MSGLNASLTGLSRAGAKPTRAAWFLKETMLPEIYWQGMLKGREWMAGPQTSSATIKAA